MFYAISTHRATAPEMCGPYNTLAEAIDAMVFKFSSWAKITREQLKFSFVQIDGNGNLTFRTMNMPYLSMQIGNQT